MEEVEPESDVEGGAGEGMGRGGGVEWVDEGDDGLPYFGGGDVDMDA